MRVVLDAGAAYELLTGGHGAPGVAAALRGAGAAPAAPELLDVEVAGALRRAVAAGDLEPEPALRVLAGLAAMPLSRWPHRPLVARAWALRDRLTAYDACYLALAERLAGPGRGLLLTTDRRLARVAVAVGTIDVEVVPVG